MADTDILLLRAKNAKISRNQYRREKALHLIPFKTSQDLFARFRGVLSLIPNQGS